MLSQHTKDNTFVVAVHLPRAALFVSFKCLSHNNPWGEWKNSCLHAFITLSRVQQVTYRRMSRHTNTANTPLGSIPQNIWMSQRIGLLGFLLRGMIMKHTRRHTHKGLPADHEPFVTSTPVRMFTIPYRGLRDQISSRGSRKKYGPEEVEREGERETGHLEMPGEVLLRSMPRCWVSTSPSPDEWHHWCSPFNVWNTNILPLLPSACPGLTEPGPLSMFDCHLPSNNIYTAI